MTIHNPQEVAKIMSELPEKLQDFLASPECINELVDISKKYHLHVDQTGRLSDQVVYTIMGLESLTSFNSRIIKDLGISEDVANLVIYDINQKIFSKIRAELEENSQRLAATEAPSVKTPGPTLQVNVQTNQTLPTQNTSAPQVFDAKMHGVANVPKQEVAVTPQTGDNKVRDPYRESIV